MTTETRKMNGRDYQIVTERLVQIEGVDYVRCPLHGLIPLDHHCVKAPGDHWCREAAHPAFDPELGNDDQACSSEDWDRIQAMKVANWKRTAEIAVEALRLADEYLDGFVWLEDPEYTELRGIKRSSKTAQRRVAVLINGNGLSAKQSAQINAEWEAERAAHPGRGGPDGS